VCFEQPKVHVQLERLQKDDENSAVAGAASANTVAKLADLSQQVQLANLQLEAHSQEKDTLREQLTAAREQNQVASQNIDSVGKFLLQCMDDVKSKVVDIETASAPGEDTKISVLPGGSP
jgi:outer membrane murein-binding lipoprotein Lpp